MANYLVKVSLTAFGLACGALVPVLLVLGEAGLLG